MSRKHKTPESQSETSLGQRLAAVREKRGLPVEKAAHDTRIRVQRLRELESDDYSHFPHPSYARMFLTDYAKYLSIPVAEIKALLPDSGDCGAGGYQYLQEMSGDVAPETTIRRIKPRRRLWPALVTVLVIIALGVVALQTAVVLRKLDHLGIGQPAESAEVVPVPTPAEEPEHSVVAEDVALLNESLARPVEDFAPMPATLVTPSATPDDRAAFFVGSGLDPSAGLQ